MNINQCQTREKCGICRKKPWKKQGQIRKMKENQWKNKENQWENKDNVRNNEGTPMEKQRKPGKPMESKEQVKN